MERFTYREGYQHRFQWSFLLPHYWLIWLGILALLLLAVTPFRLRDKLAASLGKIAIRRLKGRKQYHRAEVNLRYCFPEWSTEKREAVIEKMFITAAQMLLGIGEIALASKKRLRQRSEFVNLEIIREARQRGKNVILLVPHTWSIDAAGIILHSYEMPMTAMYHPHNNPLVDWLWNSVRERFGGKVHARQNGIKPFLLDVKKGNLGYFLPDEDFGEAMSVYVPFFATEKATLPGLTKMARIANAEVIPLCSRYDAIEGKYKIEVLPPLLFSGTEEQSAREMNRVIEQFISPYPEQYVWIFRLLKTRRDGQDIYKRP